MKFILNENTKFLLEERVILTEADEAEVKTTLKWVELLLKNVRNDAVGYTKLKKYLEAITRGGPLAPKSVPSYDTPLNKIKETAKDLTDALQLFTSATTDQKKELVPINKAISAYIAALNKATVGEKYKNQLQKAIKTLEALNKQLPTTDTAVSTLSDKDFSRLVKQLQQLPKLLEQLAALLKTAFDTTASQTRHDKLKALQDLCVEGAGDRGLLKDTAQFKPTEKNLELFTDTTLKDYQTRISTALKAVQALETYPGPDKVLADLDKYYKQIELVITRFKQVLESAVYANLDNIKTAEEEKEKKGIDWKSKLARASSRTKLTVIEEFVYTNWKKEDQAEVLKIKETLLKECEAYGFTSNPFVDFISNIYLTYHLSPEIYNVIHNLVVDRILTIADLRGAGLLKKVNLIFCKDLYSKSVGEIKLYLRKQAKLVQVTWTAATEGRKLFKTPAAMAYYALYTHATIPKIREDNDAENRADVPASELSTTLKLRPMHEVEKYEEAWIGTISDTSEDSKPKTASNDVILNQIKDTEEAAKVITTLVLKFSSNTKIAAKANTCVEVRTLLASSTTPTELAKLVASVESKFNIIEITASNALKLIESILTSTKFSLKVE